MKAIHETLKQVSPWEVIDETSDASYDSRRRAGCAGLWRRHCPARPARAAKQYGPGVTDTEIKIGNTGPYSGPLSNASPIPISMAAYFKMINEQGGINGRKINFISYDDGYSPPKTVEMTRKLVEEDQVLFIAGALGTPTNSAVWHYMNEKKVPQLFVSTGATKWDDPKGHPWTMGFFVSIPERGAHLRGLYPEEQARRQDRRALSERRFRQGLSEGRDRRARRQGRVDDQGQGIPTRPPTRPSICKSSSMKAAGCDVLVTIAIPKFAAQAIKKVAEIGWKPLHILNGIATSVGATLKPAGLENCQGIVTDNSFKDPTDPAMERRCGLQMVGRRSWTSITRAATRPINRTSTASRLPRRPSRC